MARRVHVGSAATLSEYEAIAHLAPAVRELRAEADPALSAAGRVAFSRALRGRIPPARTAQRRAHDDFMVFTQIRRWIEILARLN